MDAPVELKRKVLATVTALKEGLIERETEVRHPFPCCQTFLGCQTFSSRSGYP